MQDCIVEMTASMVAAARGIERTRVLGERLGGMIERGEIDAADVLLHFDRLVDAGDGAGDGAVLTSYFEAADVLARQADALARGLDRLLFRLAVRRARILATAAGRTPSAN